MCVNKFEGEVSLLSKKVLVNIIIDHERYPYYRINYIIYLMYSMPILFHKYYLYRTE